jgi:hypothetical protein
MLSNKSIRAAIMRRRVLKLSSTALDRVAFIPYSVTMSFVELNKMTYGFFGVHTCMKKSGNVKQAKVIYKTAIRVVEQSILLNIPPPPPR